MQVTDLFQNILSYYRTGDDTYLSQVGITGKPALLSIANQSYKDMKDFIEKVLIQPNIYNEETAKLFLTLLEIFATLRTIAVLRRSISNPFVIPDEAVAEFLKSYGFDIFHLFDNGTRRYILADLFNIYKSMGTVQGVADIVKLLGFPSVRILEHWVEVVGGDYLITSKVAYGGSSTAASALTFFVDDPIIQDDPLWRLTSSEIAALEATEPWKLPAKTPYFSVLADYDVFGTSSRVSAFIASLVSSELAELENTGSISSKPIYSEMWEQNLSFTEIILAHTLCWEYGYGWDATKIPEQAATSGGPAHVFGDGSIEYDDGQAVHDEQLVDQYPVRKIDYTKTIEDYNSAFSIIITEYNDLVGNIEASEYRTRKTKLNEFISTFTSEGNYRIVDNVVNKVGPELRSINEPFYVFIAQKIVEGKAIETADTLLMDLQSYFVAATGLYFNLNPRIDIDVLKEAISFIKPYRARPLVISTANILKDPWDTFYLEEKIYSYGKTRIKCPYAQYDASERYDFLVYDFLKGQEVPYYHDEMYGFDEGMVFDTTHWTESLQHDRGLFFDSLPRFDDPIKNSNFCNVFEIREIVKTTGYHIIKKLLYDEGIDYNGSNSYGEGDEFIIGEGIILKRIRHAEYNNGCVYDLHPDNTYDDDTCYVEISEVVAHG